jgi:hypothetical protein
LTETEAQIERLLEQGQPEHAQELAGANYEERLTSGRLAEGRACLRRALAGSAAPTGARASALLAAGMLAFRQADDDDARVAFEDALGVARNVGDIAQQGVRSRASRASRCVRAILSACSCWRATPGTRTTGSAIGPALRPRDT